MSFTAYKHWETIEGLEKDIVKYLADIETASQDYLDVESENEKKDRIARVFHIFNTVKGAVKTALGTREVLEKKEMLFLIRMNEDNLIMPCEEVEALWKGYIEGSWDTSRDEYINEQEFQFIFKTRKFILKPSSKVWSTSWSFA